MSSYKKPPSRVGKVQVSAWTDQEVRDRIREIALINGRTVDEMVQEALALLFRRYPDSTGEPRSEMFQ